MERPGRVANDASDNVPTNDVANDASDKIADDADLNLKQVAQVLDVHYMTAYRYVRQGRLRGERIGTEWRVPVQAVADFRRGRETVGDARLSPASATAATDWTARLLRPLETGDEPTAWRVIEDILSAGHDLAFCYLDVLAPTLAEVNTRAGHGAQSSATPALATIVTQRLVARLGPRFRRPGRTRGNVVLGAPRGEHHLLPLSMLADLLRARGFGVGELGTNLPAEALAEAARRTDRLLAVGLGITTAERLDAAREAIAATRAAVPTVPIVVGGQAVLNPDIARLLAADAWAPDGRAAIRIILDLADGPPTNGGNR